MCVCVCVCVLDFERSFYLVGMILRQEGEIQGSLEMFQQAALLNPNNVENIKQVARSQ